MDGRLYLFGDVASFSSIALEAEGRGTSSGSGERLPPARASSPDLSGPEACDHREPEPAGKRPGGVVTFRVPVEVPPGPTEADPVTRTYMAVIMERNCCDWSSPLPQIGISRSGGSDTASTLPAVYHPPSYIGCPEVRHMAHKVYVSFKTEDIEYKLTIQRMDVDYVDRSLNVAINSTDPDYINRRIREDYLADSTVTIHLIGNRSSEALGAYEQRFIKAELQASLFDGVRNTKNGILGIVLPRMMNTVYQGIAQCQTCGGRHSLVAIGDTTTVREFSYNYYIPTGRCYHTEADRYCVLVGWEAFRQSPEGYIDQAYDKRTALIASKTRIRPGS